MFCPQCGSATPPQTKFCKSCGSALFDLVPTASLPTPEVAQRQLRNLKGAKVLAFSPLFWLFSLFVLFIAATTHGPEQEIAGIIAFFSTMFSLGVTGWGLFNLWRGDFFKTYREQRVRAEAALLANKPKTRMLPPTPPAAALPEIASPQPASLFSGGVTEHTTRHLQSQPSNPGKPS